MTVLPLFADFDGVTYEPVHDRVRLTGQLERVFVYMSDEAWHFLSAIAAGARGSEASVSARLRDLRKPKFGAYVVQRQRVTGGLWKYRLVLPPLELGL